MHKHTQKKAKEREREMVVVMLAGRDLVALSNRVTFFVLEGLGTTEWQEEIRHWEVVENDTAPNCARPRSRKDPPTHTQVRVFFLFSSFLSFLSKQLYTLYLSPSAFTRTSLSNIDFIHYREMDKSRRDCCQTYSAAVRKRENPSTPTEREAAVISARPNPPQRHSPSG